MAAEIGGGAEPLIGHAAHEEQQDDERGDDERWKQRISGTHANALPRRFHMQAGSARLSDGFCVEGGFVENVLRRASHPCCGYRLVDVARIS